MFRRRLKRRNGAINARIQLAASSRLTTAATATLLAAIWRFHNSKNLKVKE